MRITAILMLSLVLCVAASSKAQDTLPRIAVNNLNGRIIVSWINGYTDSISILSIQRSYDSLGNYATIGSVLNPMSKENGYTDAQPPYNKMFYRLFIGFSSGKYLITQPARPFKAIAPPININLNETIQLAPEIDSVNDSVAVVGDSIIKLKKDTLLVQPINGKTNKVLKPGAVTSTQVVPPPELKQVPATYPSQRIFTAKDQNIIIDLPDAGIKNYTAKFFDEQDKEIFILSSIREDFLIIEKVNFIKSGWFHFELYRDGMLIEKNKFYVAKDKEKKMK